MDCEPKQRCEHAYASARCAGSISGKRMVEEPLIKSSAHSDSQLTFWPTLMVVAHLEVACRHDGQKSGLLMRIRALLIAFLVVAASVLTALQANAAATVYI